MHYSVGAYFGIGSLIIVVMFLFFIISLITILKIIQADNVNKSAGIFHGYKEAIESLPQFLFDKILYLYKIILWSLVFLLPGLIFGILYSFSGLAFLVDQKRGTEALILSKKIIKQSLVQFLGYSLLALLYSTGIAFPMIYSLDLISNISYEKGWYFVVFMIEYGEYIVIGMSSILFLVFFYSIYQELKNRHHLLGKST